MTELSIKIKFLLQKKKKTQKGDEYKIINLGTKEHVETYRGVKDKIWASVTKWVKKTEVKAVAYTVGLI